MSSTEAQTGLHDPWPDYERAVAKAERNATSAYESFRRQASRINDTTSQDAKLQTVWATEAAKNVEAGLPIAVKVFFRDGDRDPVLTYRKTLNSVPVPHTQLALETGEICIVHYAFWMRDPIDGAIRPVLHVLVD